MNMKRVESEGVGDNDGFFECDNVSASTLTDVLCDAKKLLTRWTGELDAPAEELRMVEKLIKVVDNLSDALNKAANEMLITPTCTKGGREALKSLTGQASADT